LTDLQVAPIISASVALVRRLRASFFYLQPLLSTTR